MAAKPTSIKGTECGSSGCALKAVELTSGDLLLVSHSRLRSAQYVVVDGAFATTPFLHKAGELGLRVLTRLKGNLPELLAASRHRFPCGPPATAFQHGADRVEMWDAEDFDPWETLDWETVRVFSYCQHKPEGTVVEAYWLTSFPSSTVGSQSLFRMAKSRWQTVGMMMADMLEAVTALGVVEALVLDLVARTQ